jgi:putative ABC transport system substrate-binding protein
MDIETCHPAARPAAIVKHADRRRRIGVLLPVPRNDHFLAAMEEGLREVGWASETNVEFEVRRAAGTVEEYQDFANELAALNLDVLVTASTPAATALAQATTSTPIVFVNIFDPVAAGLVASMQRSGNNLTGIAGFRADIAAHWVSILKEIAPRVSRMAILFNPATAAMLPNHLRVAQPAAAALGVELIEARVDALADLEDVVAGIAKDSHAGFIVIPHTFAFTHRDAVVAAIAKRQVRAIYGISEMVRSGGLLSYGPDIGDQWRAAAWHIDQILRGAQPGELPVTFSTKVALAINLKTARALGLVVPPALLSRAVEVIE